MNKTIGYIIAFEGNVVLDWFDTPNEELSEQIESCCSYQDEHDILKWLKPINPNFSRDGIKIYKIYSVSREETEYFFAGEWASLSTDNLVAFAEGESLSLESLE